MSWYAQHETGHPNYADAGSELEAVLVRLGYVEVPAPGSVEPEHTGEPPEGENVEEPGGTGNDDKPDPDAVNRRRGHGGRVEASFGDDE
ncbi:hypothetical protein [Amycolatopsis sp. BJA-103]|nr:hypothetical protein [Amycolatopsis sp. BJA-103]